MTLPIYRLRRWLLGIAVLFIAMIAGIYFYARMRARDVLKEIPNKLGFDVKQTASGFQFSKSDGKRTLFTIQAGDLKQFKMDGSAELHKVSIVLYGRDSTRFDQIYGDAFTYDKKSGDIRASGEVQIDLEANPTGLTGPDQGTPKELKNPIHLQTRDLVFNQGSGNASTVAHVDFRTPQASGSAIGMDYTAKTNTLTLVSQIHVTISGEHAASLSATHGIITREPRLIVLDHAHLERESGSVRAEQVRFFLGPNNNLERVLATGNVNAQSKEQEGYNTTARADEAELLLEGKRTQLRTATLTGNVQVERGGIQAMKGDAGRVILDFSGENQLRKVHAADGVKLAQHDTHGRHSSGMSDNNSTQDFDLSASAIDFFVAKGRQLDHAQTSGAAQIIISSPDNSGPTTAQAGQKTVITAGRFDAKFVATPQGATRLASIHGAPDVKIVNGVTGWPDRVSRSQTLDASFLPQGGIESIVQQGGVAYSDGQPLNKRIQAWADRATYTPGGETLVLSGSPRVSNGAMVTTARAIRIHRVSSDAFADGDVKSTYSELREQPNGALLAAASPIHVTASSMTLHSSPAIALYQGNARLWQDANLIQAPSIEFDRDRRALVAQGTAVQPVSTVLVQAAGIDRGKVDGKSAPRSKNLDKKAVPSSTVTISAAKLTYEDSERCARYEGGVVAKGNGFTASASVIDAFLMPRSQGHGNQALAQPGELDRMVAEGKVSIQQANRRATGDHLDYTAAEDKFVLTGGPPSIFDAERGRLTGVSLTFFRADDRVLVEGEASTPVVTQTRVAR